jgi:RNA polymerase sigma factor (sigma-70 family)
VSARCKGGYEARKHLGPAPERDLSPAEVKMALDALINRFRGPLIGLIASWGASPRDSVELATDTFAEAYLSRMRFHGDWNNEKDVGRWLRGIASNLHKTAIAKTRRGPRSIESLGERDFAQAESELATDGTDRVRAAMDRLQGSWRAVLFMHYIEDSPLVEIAALLGVSERSVEGRLRRARAALRDLLEPGEGREGGAARDQDGQEEGMGK